MNQVHVDQKNTSPTSSWPSFLITGTAAHSRIAKFLPLDWYDETQHVKESGFLKTRHSIDFLWENRPIKETKTYRDHVKCYSHLPHGIALLDDKGKIAQLLSSSSKKDLDFLAVLETVVFQGIDEFHIFLQEYLSLKKDINENGHDTVTSSSSSSSLTTTELQTCSCCGHSFDNNYDTTICSTCEYYTQQVWVIKDVHSNGASGIWFLNNSIPKIEIQKSLFPKQQQDVTRKFVAQRYAWPLILFQGRKFHIRVYVMFTCDGQVYIHKCAFLHVANQLFQYPFKATTEQKDKQQTRENVDVESVMSFEPSMHITNCCANSHDLENFSGEICADLTQYLNNSSCQGNTTSTTAATTTSASSFFSPFYEAVSTTNAQTHPTIIPLAEFFPSIVASIQTLAQQSFYFLQGGEANHSFEYLGIDFILSYRPCSSSSPTTTNTNSTMNHPITFHGPNNIPLAYLLEVNAPPSQDTATGLPQAEALHDQVLKDWINYWVIPHVMSQCPDSKNLGGWIHIYTSMTNKNSVMLSNDSIITPPSKNAWLNKIRWALYEKKIKKQEMRRQYAADARSQELQIRSCPLPTLKRYNESNLSELTQIDSIMTRFRREHFPFFREHVSDKYGSNILVRSFPRPWIYFENAGGTQIPTHVMNSITQSLSHRHREVLGSQDKARARIIFSWFLRAPQSSHEIFFGQNATTLFDRLAHVMIENQYLQNADEIIIATENHRAHVDPWLRLKQYGINILWWKSYTTRNESKSDEVYSAETRLRTLLTPKTTLVCLSHASNVLGSIRNIKSLCSVIREYLKDMVGVRSIQIIVDGVGAASHVIPNVAYDDIDWYVISSHKLYGPTMGVLCGKKDSLHIHEC